MLNGFVEKPVQPRGTAILAVGPAGILPAGKRAKQQARCLSSRQAGSLCPPVPKLFNKAMLNQGLPFTVHGSRVTNPPLSGCPQTSKSNHQPSLKRALQKGASLRPTAEGRWLP